MKNNRLLAEELKQAQNDLKIIKEKINKPKEESSEEEDPYVIDDFYSDSDSTPTGDLPKTETAKFGGEN